MLVNLSILPIYLYLIHGVTSSHFRNVKRVPRRHTEVTRTYAYNHPPIPNDEIPVIVVYDYQEEGNEKGRKADLTTKDERKYNSGKSINLKTPNVSHSIRSLLPGVDDFKEESHFNPRARSIKLPVATTNRTITPAESVTQAAITSRRRIQKVRKIKVNKNQPNVNVSESKITRNKTEKIEAITTSPQTGSTKPPLRVQQTFSPRNGTRDPVVPIIESENYVFSHSGDFHYSYEGGDGTKAYERGELKSSNGGSGSAVEGHFSYKDEDGNDVSLSYTADENGYRPVGAHLPTPPPIPIAIQRALAYLATKTTPEPITEKIRTL